MFVHSIITKGRNISGFFFKVSIFIIACTFWNSVLAQSVDETNRLKVLLAGKTGEQLVNMDFNYLNGKKIEIDTVFFSTGNDTILIYFNKALAEMPFRRETINQLNDSVTRILPDTLKNAVLRMYANGILFEKLIPNYYLKTETSPDAERLPQNNGIRPPRKNLVKRERPYLVTNGLNDANIALWNSHGWYYEQKFDRWEWQRARLFTTVEDISPTSVVVPYLLPMLENAGANTYLARERDWQPNEVIVDNDGSNGRSKLYKPRRTQKEAGGFAIGQVPYTGENPFKQGTYLEISEKTKRKNVVYLPDFPETGEYSVYVSYAKGNGEVTYRVYHTGGFTDFKVDQRMGFKTWVYLGRFRFQKGKDKEHGKVVLLVPGDREQLITADAVRFGGGMGLISRNGKTSQRARFWEGARYNLQYSGAPDTLTWSLSNGKNDYTDDYRCRGEWVDWLIGKPFAPNKDRNAEGLNIPVDLSFAFHTDAGILPDDQIVGTLGIYSTANDDGFFPDGQSKYASRDLTDLIQTQLVNDISDLFKVDWTRRGMWNSDYSEAYRPNVPAMLLELLSHQNLSDMRYMLDPGFKFDVARAIYKGMLRFLSTQYNYPYVVQPLPVDHLYAEFFSGDEITLSWLPVADPLESTANPTGYVVYKRIGDNGFDNGTYTSGTSLTVPVPEKGKIYSFRVAAVNAGGESFPSEEISVGIVEKSKGNVLIVNGFDRVSGPEIFETGSLSGVMRNLDQGVAYGYDICTTGDQYDFAGKKAWTDDDNPGHGASYADLETTVFRGNTFDFALVHGKSILKAGYSFVTASDEAMEDELFDITKYKFADLLYGEEKTTRLPGNDSIPRFSIYNDKMLTTLEKYALLGGNIFISGAYIGSDISNDTIMQKRIYNLLKMKFRTDHAVKYVHFYSAAKEFNLAGTVNTDYNLQQYIVESPDAIEPFGEGTETIFRYNENNTSAGIAGKSDYGVVALGFPFEAIKNQLTRDKLMQQIFDYFTEK